MDRWYNDESIDKTPIISSRIRIARNLKDYLFPMLIDDNSSEEMITSVASCILNSTHALDKKIQFLNLKNVLDIDKRILFEKHMISLDMVKSSKIGGLLCDGDKSLNIMLNEEDHIRIQTIVPSDNIMEAWQEADIIDNCIEENFEYAFDKQFGYLTACPTNTGTGLRASFMIHIPMLEKSGQLKSMMPSLNKFGLTVRGLYGEGTEPIASIYQISNQITLGRSEKEIIETLQNVTAQIIEMENNLLEKTISANKLAFVDNLYRSYGILTNCRQISSDEAMTLLSNVRIGLQTGLLHIEKPKETIYKIMINIQPASLSKPYSKWLLESERDEMRASYLRSVL